MIIGTVIIIFPTVFTAHVIPTIFSGSKVEEVMSFGSFPIRNYIITGKH